MKQIFLGLAFAGGIVVASVVPAHGASVTICHIPPGNHAAAQTISVGASAVKAHLAHGDTVGACGVGNGPGVGGL